MGRPLGVPRAVDFEDAASAQAGSPLAARLFALGGVCRVLLGADFVSVTKSPEVAWRPLGDRIAEVVRTHLGSGAPVLAEGFAPEPSHAPATAEVEHIQHALEREIRPLVARDGGDVRFVDYRDGVLKLDLQGACVDCPASKRTLKLTIEARLRELVPELVEVIAR